jgi:hypothetical protein
LLAICVSLRSLISVAFLASCDFLRSLLSISSTSLQSPAPIPAKPCSRRDPSFSPPLQRCILASPPLPFNAASFPLLFMAGSSSFSSSPHLSSPHTHAPRPLASIAAHPYTPPSNPSNLDLGVEFSALGELGEDGALGRLLGTAG